MYHAPVGIGAAGAGSTRAGAASPTAPRDRLVAALDRIEAIEPHIQALLPEPGRRERVLFELEALTARFPEPARRPPLFGVPFGVKDIFRAAGFETRAGSRLPAHLFSGPESTAVSRLREAGAIVIGKSVTTEFAYFQPGPTRNPWNTEHTPGGSSSGSAAAVSAGYVPLALGTQTIGSINRPASFCGVVGFKGSHGRVPTDGVITFSESADHVGLLAADVESARAGASVLWDRWRADARPPAGVVLLVDDAYTEQADAQARRVAEESARALEQAGWSVRRVRLFDDIEEINETHNRMVAREFASVHAGWIVDHRRLYSERSLGLIEIGRCVSDADLDRARAGRLDLRERIERLMAAEGAACLISPSAAGAAPHGIDATGSPLLNLPWTYAGVPTVTLPAGLSARGLPIGLQLAGRFNHDEELLSLAAVFEDVVGRRVARR